MFEKDAINLTFVHPWMTVSDALLLFEDAFERFKPYKKYHGWKNVHTLMNISLVFGKENLKNTSGQD